MAGKKDEVQEALKPIAPPSETKTKRQRAGSGSSKPTGDQLTFPQLQSALENSFKLVGMGLMGFDQFDGELVVNKAGEMADSLVEIAKVDPKVRARLQSLIGVSAWGGVITVFGAQVALPIAVHHNMLPTPMNAYLAAEGDIEVKGPPDLSNVVDIPDMKEDKQ